jgi:hypothetical protein
MEVLTGGEAGGNGGFGEEVEDKTMWHGDRSRVQQYGG